MSEKLTYRVTNTRTCVKKRKRSIGKTLYGKQIVQKKLKVIKKKIEDEPNRWQRSSRNIHICAGAYSYGGIKELNESVSYLFFLWYRSNEFGPILKIDSLNLLASLVYLNLVEY